MELEALYTLAENETVTVCEKRLEYSKCFSVMDCDGDCSIAIDGSQFNTVAEEKAALAHDLGHCMTGSFYNRYSPYDIKSRHERRASKKAAYLLVPLDELADAVQSPWNSVYDLSERFGVPEGFMRKTLEIYENELSELVRQ